MAKKKKNQTPDPGWMTFAAWAIPLIAILAYLPAFAAGFTFDDIPIIEDNALVRSVNKLGEIWQAHYWAGKLDANDVSLYRPLTLSTYNIQYAITGDKPGPFHAVNILLHAGVAALVMLTLLRLFRNRRLALVSGLLFAIHPLHTEAVSGIVGRAELLAAGFILLSMLAYDRWRATGSWPWLLGLGLAISAAVTSKEHGFMIGPLLLLQEYYYGQIRKTGSPALQRRLLALGVAVVVSLIWLFIRSQITGPPIAHELWQGVSASERMATAVRIMMEYTWLHVIPHPLVADYWSDLAPLGSWTSPGTLAGIAVVGVLVAAVVFLRKRQPAVSWGIAFFLVTLLPVSNLLFAIGFVKAERILYIPSIGLITAIAAGILWLMARTRGRWPAIAVLTALAAGYLAGTWNRATEWENNYTLALATLRESPANPRFNNMMGKEMKDRGDIAQARTYYRRALASNPRHVPALVNLGISLGNDNQPQEAATLLERALEIDPGNLPVYVNLMSVYRALGRHDNNAALADEAVRRFPQSAAILWNAANAHQLRGDMTRANELRARARQLDPSIDPQK